MPIFQDDLEQDDLEQLGESKEGGATTSASRPVETEPILINTQHRHHHRRLSEESIRTELCEGPLPDSPKLLTPEREQEQGTCDRAELIERLKRGESPTWIPNRRVSSAERGFWVKDTNLAGQQASISTLKSPQQGSASPALLPAPRITSERRGGRVDGVDGDGDERLQEGLGIERPRSALHSGDFTQDEDGRTATGDTGTGSRASGFDVSARPWIPTSPPHDFAPFPFPCPARPPSIRDDYRSTPSSLSSSFLSSFVYKPPTSPLVQSESNDDLDLALPLHDIDITSRGSSHPRRHTLYSATSTPSTPFLFPPSRTMTTTTTTMPQKSPSLRRDSSAPYQAHQPRRSLNLAPTVNLMGSSPGTPAFLRSRRPSFGSDTSPLQHASMVGSYEESILRGRMSTTPSRPLNFLAQIGVLGLGKCKANLRCPPHVTIPFPAVFYSYANTSHVRPRPEDGPSPYVGQIDLENGLPNTEEELRARRKMQSRYADKQPTDDDVDMSGGIVSGESDVLALRLARTKRRSGSPRAPPGGSYRIPEKGRIQIIIKNQNKTAVKLFLVPYDLAGMEPGTKSFIRQRSYSAGPIVDNVPGVPEPNVSNNNNNNNNNNNSGRPVLRYLIHLHICCPSKGRFYLYKSIRIVFANRVPDDKEKLRNETTLPEPRFTPYKAIRVMHPPVAASTGPGAILAAEKAFRRRSSGYSIGHAAQMMDADDEPAPPPHLPSTSAGPSNGFTFASPSVPPVDPVPFHLPSRNRNVSEASQSTSTTTSTMRSPGMQGGTSREHAFSSNGSGGSDYDDDYGGLNMYEKLNKGDVGYGGNAFAISGGSSPGTEGLLSQRLRSLGVRGVVRGNRDSDEEQEANRFDG